MASFEEYQDYKTHQEAFRKMIGTLWSLEESLKPYISPQVALSMELSSPCLPCVITRASQTVKYPRSESISTTTNLSGGARRMGSGSGSGLKTQKR
ncbi:hypothetical protein O181_001431 [Austropuccinia psidii MF-1]|uniref:Uncharacterized protein n=1 Tax=Austropuccinia psidii MF-1 TaxID=1389203 RepID=A0A9Q3BA92_9BASI|nr:hypothetical protein [Austropuccinia psidii MF-1]